MPLSAKAAFIKYLFHFFILLYVYQSDTSIVKGLKETQKATIEEGSNYIRLQAATFFLNEYSIYPINRILGNGVPYGNSSYMNLIYQYSYKGYWLSDVGLIAVYLMFGIFAVVGYVLIWIKSFTLKVPENYYYLKYYLWFLLITCLTSDTIYSKNDLIATVIVVYIFNCVYIKNRE